MALTDVAIRSAKPAEKARKIADGGGLFLFIPPAGAKLWRMAYRYAGKQKTLAFGAYPEVSLGDARKKRDDARKLLAAGTDPGVQKRLDKIAAATAAADTFAVIADEYLAKIEKEGRAEATLDKTKWLIDFARPALGSRPVAQITAPEVLAVLRKVEGRGRLESARRLRSTLSQVFRYAIATARGVSDPCEALRGALTAPVVTNRAAITDPKAFGALLRACWGYDGQPEVAAALRLCAYLYPRPGELRQAEWSEFDLDGATWTIPAARAKMRREHRKPLPPAAVAILRDLYQLSGNGPLMFPGVRSRRRPISENTLNAALRRMGIGKDEATAHGFRASASSMLNESGKWNPDAIEAELGHVEGNDVRRAYHRSQYWDERLRMAAWWAAECDRLREGAKVIPIGGAA